MIEQAKHKMLRNQRETLSNLTESARHKNTIIDFSSLNYIQELKEEIQTIKKQLTRIEEYYKPKYNLTKRSEVLRFLEITDPTLNAYMKDGRFKENIHFKKEIKGKKIKITFVEDGILAFKQKKELK